MIKSAHHTMRDFGEIDDSPRVIVGGDSTLSQGADTTGGRRRSPSAALVRPSGFEPETCGLRVSA
jgi:hypothetical protein